MGVTVSPTSDLKTRLAEFLASGAMVADGPDAVWIGLGEFVVSSHPDPSKLSIYAPDFFLHNAKPWRLYSSFFRVPISELLEAVDSAETLMASGDWSEPDRVAFEGEVAAIQQEIAAGRLAKAIAFSFAQAPFSDHSKLSALRGAARSAGNPLLRPYGFWDSEDGMIGVTPELLFRQDRGRLQTMALAGTRTHDAPSLLDDPKECAEHAIVVEGIRERLSPLGQVSVSRAEEVKLPNLVHLCSTIEVDPLTDVSFVEWVTALHPTPAIGAWPLEAGWNWLNSRAAAADRGRYGAPFGFVPPGSDTGTCYVAIRNVQWTGDEAKIYAGCGIVAASRADHEWSELQAKLSTIRSTLGV